MSNLTESQLTEQLQRIANIDKIRQAYVNVKLRERQGLIRERAEDAQELDFEKDLH